jgi:glycosyltransferase involved in cell wall biosynthesis
MVGTIEPRKGYAQALDAFEAIWRDGCPIQLVIVGRIGWKVESLVARLRSHEQIGDRLRWFDSADDRKRRDSAYQSSKQRCMANRC